MKNNIKGKIEFYLDSNPLLENFGSYDKSKEFLEELDNQELEHIIARLRDSHTSYRMSYDKFQSVIIAAVVATVISIIPSTINLIVYPGWIMKFIEISKILLLLSISIMLLLGVYYKKYYPSFIKFNNIKTKKRYVEGEILKRIKKGKWKEDPIL